VDALSARLAALGEDVEALLANALAPARGAEEELL
jgi:hypothetical protein